MGHGVMLQDWLTIGGGTKVTQPSSRVGSVSGYRDAVLYLRVTNVAASIGVPTFLLQTAPTLDDSMFQLMDSTAQFGVTVGAKTVTLSDANIAVPLARYVRWQFTGSGTWSVTFRVWLTLAS